MKCKKFFAAAAACLMVAGFAACGNEPTPVNPDEKVFQIGIVQLAEHPALDEATRGFKEFLTEKLGDKVQFNVQNAQGEQTNCTTIVNQFVSSKVDLIMANATNAVKAAREATSDIPIIGTSVTDYVSSGLVASNEAPGANVTGASDMNPVNVQVQLMKTLCPEVKTVGIVINSGKSPAELRPKLKGYQGKVYTIDAGKISEEELGKNFPNTPMLAAIVKVSGVVEEQEFIKDMEASFKHKFASKPQVIEGNMRALKRSMEEVQEG